MGFVNLPQKNSILPDANIWVSQTLHSWIGLVASETRGQWHFYYTEDIFAEALRARRRRFPQANSSQIEAMRERLIKSGLKPITNFTIDSDVTYPDEKDAHVHSAAVYAGIEIIITDNIKDFAELYADPDDCPYEVYTADDFLILVADSSPQLIDQIILLQHKHWSKYGRIFSLPRKLRDTGCPRFANYVCGRLQHIQL